MDESPSKRSLLYQVWVVCTLGFLIDGYDLYISSIAEPFTNLRFHPSAFMAGMTQAATPIGAALGAILVGRLSNYISKRSMLIFNLLFFVVIALFSAFAWNALSLCVFRFLIGFGVGADYPFCASYLTEVSPKKQSSQLIASAMFINCTAAPVGILAAWLIFKLYPHVDAWRWMYASAAIPAFIALMLRVRLPSGFISNAHKGLTDHTKSVLANYQKLFSPKFFKMTWCLCLSWILQDISYYGIGEFTPSVLQAFHISSGTDLITSTNEVLKSTLFINIFVLAGAFATIFFVGRLNHIKMQKVGFLFSFIGLLVLGVSSHASGMLQAGMILIGFVLFNFFINFGPSMTSYMLPAEFYEEESRPTMSQGFAASLGKLGVFAGAICLPVLQVCIGIYLTTAILTGFLFVGLIWSYWNESKRSATTHQNQIKNKWVFSPI